MRSFSCHAQRKRQQIFIEISSCDMQLRHLPTISLLNFVVYHKFNEAHVADFCCDPCKCEEQFGRHIEIKLKSTKSPGDLAARFSCSATSLSDVSRASTETSANDSRARLPVARGEQQSIYSAVACRAGGRLHFAKETARKEAAESFSPRHADAIFLAGTLG